MPIRWTAETDQILLLKILETSAITVDVKKVAAAWPTNLETPTPRAISERLVRIRSLAKSTNGSSAHFAVSKPKSNIPKSSPLKITKARGTPKSGGKRKRGASSEDDDEAAEGVKDESSESEASPLKKKNAKNSAIKIKAEEVDEGVDTAFDDANDEDEDAATAEAEEEEGGEEVLA